MEYFIDGLLVEAARAQSRIRSYLEQPAAQLLPRLTPTQRTILAAASRQEVLAAGDLAGELGLSRRGIAKAISQLVAAGLLAREGVTRGSVYRITKDGFTALGAG